MTKPRNGSPGGAWHWSSYLFVLPAIVLVVGVVYGGIGYNAWVSTTEWNGISSTYQPVGLGNYVRALGDPIVRSSYLHVAIFAAITISTQLVLGLAMALALSCPSRLNSLYTACMFLPVVIAPAAVSSAFRQILSPDGPVNDILRALGQADLARGWLSDPTTALIALAAVNIWQWTGFSFILYQAALTQLDDATLDAAQIDGAGLWRTIWSIIVPQLTGTHVTLVLLGLIGSLKTFDLVFLTTGGGPARATEFPATYIYQQTVERFNAGYGATLAMLLLVTAVIIAIIQRLPDWVRRQS